MDRCLNMADSLPFEDDEALADSQEHPGRVMVLHTQRYLVEKVRDLLIGVFSSMFLCSQHNSVPTLSDSRIFRGSVILKAVSTKGRAILYFVLGQLILNLWSFLTGYLSTQFSALQVSSKSKRVRQKKNSSTLRKGGEGFAKQEEGSPVIKRPSDQGKDSDGGVSAQSAFRRLIVNDVLSSFIPRPGPLGMDICSKNSAKSCIKESQIAFKSAYKRNAIASSYSSTLAQWPPERVPTRATGRAVPRTASGATAGAATQPTRGAAPGSASRAAAGATRGAAPDAAAGATRGAARDAAAGATRGAAPDAAAGASRGAAPDADAGVTQDAVPGAVSGTATGAAAQPTGGATPGAAPDADVYTTRAASGAAADADADLDAVSDAVPCTLPSPSQDSSQSTEAAKKGDERDGAPSGISKKKEKREKRKKEKKEKKKAKQAAAAAAADAARDKQDKQGKQGNPKKSFSTSDIPKPVRRKIPLFPPHRRNIPLVLPPPPELCFPITVEDFDLEKKTAMQWINKVLKDDGTKARCN